jgi:putative transposase
MRAVCADFETELVEFNGERDHVHLLVHHPPKVSISKLVGALKGVSARRLRQQYPDHIRNYLSGAHFWSPSYFAASCGGAPLSVINDYIEQQKSPT